MDTISLRKGHLFGFYSNALNTLMSAQMSLSTGITAATLIDLCMCTYNAHNLMCNHFAAVLRNCGFLASEIVLAPVSGANTSEFVHACGADAFQEAAEEMSKLQGNVFLTARGREIWKTEQALFRQ